MNNQTNNYYPKPEWDEEVGKSYIGKYILVGITYRDGDGNDIRKQQIHGIIESASEEDGILIKLQGKHGGETWVMPPDQRAISKARPGTTYTLRESGEKVENPDLLSTWIEGSVEEENT